MQVLCKNRGPIPNMISPFLGDFGTLVLRTADRWYVWSKNSFHPVEGYTRQGFIRQFYTATPSNLSDGYWGICQLGETDINWTKGDVQACLDIFVDMKKDEYQKPDGMCFDPFNKGRRIKAGLNRKQRPLIIEKAPQPAMHEVNQLVPQN